ncbi:MAG: hypothetical protein KGJ31_01455 [Patescibacteria group bacterium]|nr:hypothetical protein [Patescibacteria group bacterium]
MNDRELFKSAIPSGRRKGSAKMLLWGTIAAVIVASALIFEWGTFYPALFPQWLSSRIVSVQSAVRSFRTVPKPVAEPKPEGNKAEITVPPVAEPKIIASSPAPPAPSPVPPAAKKKVPKPAPKTQRQMEKKTVKQSSAPKASVATKRPAEGAWQHWGAAPYAHSLEEACQKAPAAIDGTSMPQAVKEHFKKALGDCKGGTLVWLTPNEPLEQMWSGGRHPHLMNHVAVAELPVLRSPDGRPYRKGAVAEAAKALEWSYVYEGETYLWDIPFVCFNESWRFGRTSSVAEKCVELSFDAPVGGNVRWGIGSTEGPLPPTSCNAQRQGSLAWTAWLGECDVCVPALGYIRGILGSTAEIPHRYLYPALTRRQTLRFSTAIWSRVVYLCLAYADGTQTCGVYMRPQDWRGRYRVDIPDELWLKDNGDCPQ